MGERYIIESPEDCISLKGSFQMIDSGDTAFMVVR